MSWPIVALSEICNFENGDRGKNYPSKSAIVDSGIPFINAGHLNNNLITDSGLNYIAEDHFRRLSNGKFRKGDFLFCLRGTLGKFAFVDREIQGAIASSLVIIRPNEKLHPGYLNSYLASNLCADQIDRYKNGAAQPNLAAASLKQFEIPLPPFDEQKRIAAILDKADELRRKRQRAVDRLNQLGQAIFHDMFGDPVANPKNFPVRKLGEVGILDRGKSQHRPRNDPALLGGDHPLIQTGDVANSNGYIRLFSSTYSDLGLAQSRKWPVGTLCITIAANIGKTAILEIEACFPDSVVGFTPDQGTNAEYVQYWMENIQKRLEEVAPQSAQKNINLAILRDLPIPLPRRAAQDTFRGAIREIENQKAIIRKAQRGTDVHFLSLQHRAFRGEL